MTLLRHHVMTLRLRANAPWPSQISVRQGYRTMMDDVFQAPTGANLVKEK